VIEEEAKHGVSEKDTRTYARTYAVVPVLILSALPNLSSPRVLVLIDAILCMPIDCEVIVDDDQADV
jgi:hypothetical protein